MFEEINLSRRRFLGTAAMTIAGAQFGVITFAKTRSGDRSELSALASATAWLNSPPLTAAELDKKVVLVDFWTYSCINWRRQLPYVRAWAEKYKDQGLVVIGVHAPEFSFENSWSKCVSSHCTVGSYACNREQINGRRNRPAGSFVRQGGRDWSCRRTLRNARNGTNRKGHPRAKVEALANRRLANALEGDISHGAARASHSISPRAVVPIA